MIAACLLALPGCYSPERDLIQDPHNTPLIHILESGFDPSSGAVTVRWEFLGRDPLVRVIVRRRSGSFFDSIAAVAPTGTADRSVDQYLDPSPPAGRLLEYSVSARTASLLVDARAVQVQVPGARLLRLRRNPFQGRIQTDWQSVGNDARSFQVVRTSPSGTETLVTADAGVSTYLDTDISGDTPYTYRILSQFDGGVSLESEPLEATVYARERREAVAPGASRLAIATGSAATSATLLALVATDDDIDVSRYRYFFGASFDGTQTVGAIREETTGTRLTGVDRASLGIAGPSAFRPPSTNERAFVFGRNTGGTRVVVKAYSLPNLTKVWDGPVDWALSDAATPVAGVQGADGTTWIAADGTVRAYSVNLLEAGAFDLPFASPAVLAADDTWLWAVAALDGQLYRADISAGVGPSLAWEPVSLPVPGIRPTAITLNAFSQLFVADASAGTVHVFDDDLAHLLSWRLPTEDFSTGQMALDGGPGNLIHVSSADGNVHTYLP